MSARVAIPFPIEPNTEAYRHFVYGSYLKKLISHDLIPVMVSPLMTDLMIAQIVEEADGLLLCGGVDIDPARYGAARHPLTEPSVPERDQLEFALIELFKKQHKPIFGIRRGAQLLAVASGGTLHQHVPDLGIDEVHGHSEVKTSNDLFTAARHDILIEPGSLVERLIGAGPLSVNSAHHQAIASVGPSLRIAARSAAGVVEIIESAESSQFLLGVQPHPEADRQQVLDPLIKVFADTVKELGSRR